MDELNYDDDNRNEPLVEQNLLGGGSQEDACEDIVSLNIDYRDGDFSVLEHDEVVPDSIESEEFQNVDSHAKDHHHDTISFKGTGRCTICSCGSWAGYGDTCANCGHFFDKHA